MSERYALIAGNGQFPLLVLREARRQGVDMVVLALREETAPEIEQLGARVHWVSLGELQKALGILRQEAVHKVVLAGQVKHTQIFSDIPPDPVLKQLLALLPKKISDALIGTIARAMVPMSASLFFFGSRASNCFNTGSGGMSLKICVCFTWPASTTLWTASCRRMPSAFCSSPRLTQCTRAPNCSISGAVSSRSASTTISTPWRRASRSTSKGNWPLPAMRAYRSLMQTSYAGSQRRK